MTFLEKTGFIFLLFLSFVSKINGQAPVADFSAGILEGCVPLEVKFNDKSTGNPTSWRWDMGDGTTSAFQNPAITYTVPGIYTVQLTVTNAGGTNTLTRSAYIKVIARPGADFSSPDTLACAPSPVTFKDLSAGNGVAINKWEWSFGDGTISDEQNPVHAYNTGGSYSVFLKVTNTSGCSNTISKKQYIKLSSAVTAGFRNSTPNLCRLPISVNFFNISGGQPPIKYTWEFGDGTQSSEANPVHNYTSYGNFTVKLIVESSNGCSSTFQKELILSARNNTLNGPAAICQGTAGNFSINTDPQAGSVLWNMGDGTLYTTDTIAHTYNSNGNFTIRVVADFGSCRDTIIKTILVNEKPKVDFSVSDRANCKPPFAVTFNNLTTTPGNYKWFFGDGDSSVDNNPAHTYTALGSYAVTLSGTSALGCKVSTVKSNFIKIGEPEIFFSNLPGKGCKPYTFSPAFNIDSTDVLTGFQWNFGDGSTSTERNPAHVYTDSGSYNLQLTITSRDGCTTTANVPKAVLVGTPDKADFTVEQAEVCGRAKVQFKAIADPAITTFAWSFGDNNFSAEKDPVHQYGDTGTYTVQFAVEKNGCSSQVTKTAFIKVLPPVADFSITKNCNNKKQISFTNTSKGALTTQWNFGDNTFSADPNPVHVYQNSGVYNVTLITTSVNCSDTIIKPVSIVLVNPTISAEKDTLCKNESTNLIINHPNPNSIVNYFWYPNGNTDTTILSTTSSGLTYSFVSAGSFNVTGYTVDSFGCTDSVIIPVIVTVFGPQANFGVENIKGCLNSAAVFVDSSKLDAGNRVTSWTWNFGDGTDTTYAAPPFTHTYNIGGTYSVKLSITDALGCTDEITKFDYVSRTEGAANFETPDTLTCRKSTVVFNNTSTGVITSSFWDFGDGATSTEQFAIHNYADSGAYTVKLRVTGVNGCIDSITKPAFITVRDPKASFNVSDTFISCPPVPVTFFDSSYNAVNYQWDFGDGNFASVEKPVNIYLEPGRFSASLRVTSNGGCTDVMTKDITVIAPYGTLVYDTAKGCAPLTVTFKAKTFGANKFLWDFGNGNTETTADSTITYTYQKSGSYIPSVVLQDGSGCSITVYGNDTLRIDDFSAGFTADKIAFCDSGTVKFTDSITDVFSNITYAWDFGDGQQSTQKNPEHLYRAPGNYTVTHTAFSSGGCKQIASYNSFIKVAATPALVITGMVDVCAIDRVAFKSNIIDTTDVASWKWVFGNGKTSTAALPPIQLFTDPGTYQNSLEIITNAGCSSSTTTSVEIKNKPEIIDLTDTTICSGDAIAITAKGLTNYNWQPSAGLSCTNCSTPNASPLVSSWYYVSGLQAQTNCAVSDSLFIRVVQPYQLLVSEDIVLCQSGQVQLRASGAPAYAWFPTTGLNNAFIPNPVVTVNATTTYQVIGYDSTGCFNDTATISVRIAAKPTVDLGQDVVLSVGSTYNFQPVVSADVINYSWSPATDLTCTTCQTPQLSVKGNSSYNLKVANADGCSAQDNVNIIVTCDKSTVFIPNTFSPNNDGVNDYFYPRGKGIYTISYLAIFNRWGQKVFERKNINLNDQNSGWDGRLNGVKAEIGVYTYIIEVVCFNNQTLKYSGNINLIQ